MKQVKYYRPNYNILSAEVEIIKDAKQRRVCDIGYDSNINRQQVKLNLSLMVEINISFNCYNKLKE